MGEINLSGKVLPIRAGDLLLPAACLMCGVGNADVDKIFHDIGRDIDGYGIVYLCTDCSVEIGMAAGCVSEKMHTQILEDYAKLLTENAELKSVVERLGDGFDAAILNYLSARNITVNSDALNSVADAQVSPTSNESGADFAYEFPGDNSDVDDSESQSNVAESESSESGSSEGPDDISEPATVDSDSNNQPGGDYTPLIEL